MAVLPHLSDEARAWIYPTVAPVSAETQSALRKRLSRFVDTWTSHEHPVEGGSTVLHDRFVLLAGLQVNGQVPSGCAIDEATRAVKEAASECEIEWLPSLHVIYRADDGSIEAVSRSTFQNRIDRGDVTSTTPIFDPSVTTLGAVRDGAFEQPAHQSWAEKAFSFPAAA